MVTLLVHDMLQSHLERGALLDVLCMFLIKECMLHSDIEAQPAAVLYTHGYGFTMIHSNFKEKLIFKRRKKKKKFKDLVQKEDNCRYRNNRQVLLTYK